MVSNERHDSPRKADGLLRNERTTEDASEQRAAGGGQRPCHAEKGLPAPSILGMDELGEDRPDDGNDPASPDAL